MISSYLLYKAFVLVVTWSGISLLGLRGHQCRAAIALAGFQLAVPF